MPKEYVLWKKTEKDERHNKTCYDCEIWKELYHILQIEEKEEFLLKVKNAKKFVAEVTKVWTDNFKIRLIKVLNW